MDMMRHFRLLGACKMGKLTSMNLIYRSLVMNRTVQTLGLLMNHNLEVCILLLAYRMNPLTRRLHIGLQVDRIGWVQVLTHIFPLVEHLDMMVHRIVVEDHKLELDRILGLVLDPLDPCLVPLVLLDRILDPCPFVRVFRLRRVEIAVVLLG
jgi:hypothetical protein